MKKENVGKSKREGCLRKVLRRLWCQVKMVPVIRPGRLKEQRTIKNVIDVTDVPLKAVKKVLADSVKKQARNIMMNLMERYPPRTPPCATTLQTPTYRSRLKFLLQQIFTFRTLAMPRLAVTHEEETVIRNKEPFLYSCTMMMAALPLLEDIHSQSEDSGILNPAKKIELSANFPQFFFAENAQN